jgi:photosystem II stability/assembly factor-like uncharacterized protein
MLSTLSRLAALLLLCAPLAYSQDFQFLPAATMSDVAAKTLTDVTLAGDRLVAVGERGVIILSDDNGKSWRQANVPVSATLTAVHFPTEQQGWAVGHAGTILNSTDAGSSWSLQFDGNNANQQWLNLVKEKHKALEAQVEELRQSGDPEELLSNLEYDLEDAVFDMEDAQTALDSGPIDPFLDVLFTSPEKGWAVGAYGMVYYTENAGADWQLAAGRITNPDRYHFYAADKDEAGNLYLSGEAGLLYHSHDGGESWVQNDDVYIGSLFGIVHQGSRVFTFGLRGNIFQSEDAGVTWTPVINPTSFSLYGGSTLSNGQLKLVGAGGGIVTITGEGQLSTTMQSSRATLSSLVENADGRAILVGMEGVEFEESENE